MGQCGQCSGRAPLTGNSAEGPAPAGPGAVTSTTSPLRVKRKVPEAGSHPHPTTSPGPNRGAVLLVGGSCGSKNDSTVPSEWYAMDPAAKPGSNTLSPSRTVCAGTCTGYSRKARGRDM
jgi:hypothetical protein